MNQIPFVPQYPMVQQQMPLQQPSYNAVKIDVHNPKVETPSMPLQAPCNSQYAPVTNPIYNYPQAPVYDYPQTQQPVYYPQVPVAQAPVYQQPVTQAPQQTVCPPCQPVPAAVEQVQPKPVVTAPVEVAQAPVIQQQNINTPAQPAQEVPAPAVSAPEVVAAETVKPQLDLNEFITKLTNPDFEAQAAAMEEIANIVKENPQKATDLVDTKVFDALNKIVAFDSSKLEGPSQAQVDARQKIIDGKEVTEDEKALANKITPKEQAERNKSYALFTIAIMDKLYSDEVAKLTNQSVPLTELPEAATMVDQLKDNPNPMVRSSAIEALSYIQKPEYKQDLTTLFTVAKDDKDAGVAQAANAALEKLAQA